MHTWHVLVLSNIAVILIFSSLDPTSIFSVVIPQYEWKRFIRDQKLKKNYREEKYKQVWLVYFKHRGPAWILAVTTKQIVAVNSLILLITHNFQL